MIFSDFTFGDPALWRVGLFVGFVFLFGVLLKKRKHKHEPELFELLERILRVVQEIEDSLPSPAKSAVLTIITKDNSMPATIHLNGPGAQAVFTEFDGPNGTGNPVPAIGPIVYSSDNTSIAVVDTNGRISQVAVGTANISGTDQGNGLTASDSVTVTAQVAQSATMVIQPL